MTATMWEALSVWRSYDTNVGVDPALSGSNAETSAAGQGLSSPESSVASVVSPGFSSLAARRTMVVPPAGTPRTLSLESEGMYSTLSKMLTTSVNFRDVNLVTQTDESRLSLQESLENLDFSSLSVNVQKNKLILIMVGLPGRGKTFLCNKLMCYLNWLGHNTRHFNVGAYRRTQKHDNELQDASFFDHSNESGMEARQKALQAALDDMFKWLASDDGQVAIFDATNTTKQRRQLLRDAFHGKWQYLFIETICNDPAVLEQNYRNKMLYSPDYQGVDTEQALRDFKDRIRKYEEVYEPLDDRNQHYIKLIDMVTGRGYMDINRISGYIPGKIVFYLMQVCKAGLANVRKIWLTRHGQSEYNQKGLLGGDSNLTENGEKYARALPAVLLSRLQQIQGHEAVSVAVWTSTLKRTIATARQLPFPKLRWKALDEIDAGICDGLSYDEVKEKFPQEYEARKRDKLRYRYPSGESYLDVIQRIEPVIIELERERECVVIVAHQAVLRAMYGYFMDLPQESIPNNEMPLHTLIELTPMPDGSMKEERIPIDINNIDLTSPNTSGDYTAALQTIPSPLAYEPTAVQA